MSFRNSVKGLDQLISGDMKEGYVILITGAPGTLKTAFTFTAMNGMLSESGKRGIYMTLEHKREDLLWGLKSLGITQHKNLGIVDIAGFKNNLNQISGYNITGTGFYELMLKTMESPIENGTEGPDGKPWFCAIDSLNVVLSVLRISHEDRRDFVNNFLNILKSKNMVSLVVHEETGQDLDEYYIADAVITLGIDRTDKNMPYRYIIIRKMRGIEHKLGQFVIDANKEGIEIVGQKMKT